MNILKENEINLVSGGESSVDAQGGADNSFYTYIVNLKCKGTKGVSGSSYSETPILNFDENTIGNKTAHDEILNFTKSYFAFVLDEADRGGYTKCRINRAIYGNG